MFEQRITADTAHLVEALEHRLFVHTVLIQDAICSLKIWFPTCSSHLQLHDRLTNLLTLAGITVLDAGVQGTEMAFAIDISAYR
ncbi:hypothetical protein D3C80_1129870 [compost metagenome]